ncbi:hypothetical protein [Nesterenkonia pannonica]|uniref:hypothetical protein n=1 Tax=Nesterenkonia pannonica TaxID=1548602 RepID=UPI0021641D81|nr:hypothetical protein [Nesterenkonia pannonica]
MNARASAIPPSALLPEGRTVFGLNPDWGVETLREFAETTGVGPGAAVSFVELPWDEGTWRTSPQQRTRSPSSTAC